MPLPSIFVHLVLRFIIVSYNNLTIFPVFLNTYNSNSAGVARQGATSDVEVRELSNRDSKYSRVYVASRCAVLVVLVTDRAKLCRVIGE